MTGSTREAVRVLFVSDDGLKAFFLPSLLSAAGYDVVCVTSAQVDEHLAASIRPDLILRDGHFTFADKPQEAAKNLLHAAEEIKEVILCATPRCKLCCENRSSGAIRTMFMPATPTALLSKIDKILSPNTVIDPALSIWNQETFDDLRRRLGDERARYFLTNFIERLTAVARLLKSMPREAIRPALHDLRSVSGIMGFVEVLDACSTIQSDRPGGAEDGWAALPGAIERASGVAERFQAGVSQGVGSSRSQAA